MNNMFTVFMIGISLLYGCERIGVTENSEVKEHDPVETALNGLWSGALDGSRPYFNQDPRITLELIQSDTTLSGIIRSSDGSFKNTALMNGFYTDPELFFEVRQSSYYTGSIIHFNGIITRDTIQGIWTSIQGDSGAWFIIRKKE